MSVLSRLCIMVPCLSRKMPGDLRKQKSLDISADSPVKSEMMKREVVKIKICNLYKDCSKEILYKMFILVWEISFSNKLKSVPPRKFEFTLESTSSLHMLF